MHAVDKQFLAEEEKKRQELKGVALSDFEIKATLGNAPSHPHSASQPERQLVYGELRGKSCLRSCARQGITLHFIEYICPVQG
jgi:hypothetical protein